MDEGKVAKDDEAVMLGFRRAHECELEPLEDLAEGQREIDRGKRTDNVGLSPGPREPDVADRRELPFAWWRRGGLVDRFGCLLSQPTRRFGQCNHPVARRLGLAH